MSVRNMARRTAAGTLALAACIGGGALAFAEAAHATPTEADASIVVTTGAAPYDALTAGPLATLALAPVLLQAPGDRLDPSIDAYLQRRLADQDRVTHAYVLGGPAAVSPAVVTTLQRAGVKVERLAGADRYGTAAAVADEFDRLLDA